MINLINNDKNIFYFLKILGNFALFLKKKSLREHAEIAILCSFEKIKFYLTVLFHEKVNLKR